MNMIGISRNPLSPICVTPSGSTCEEKKAGESRTVFAPNSNFMAVTDPLATQTVTPV
jgi:hypothetical protein